MKNLNRILPLVVLCIAVMGCGMLTSSPNVNSPEPAANSTPSRGKLVVDIPSLLGKSRDDIKKQLGPPNDEIGGGLQYGFPQGDLNLSYSSLKKGQMEFMSFRPKTIQEVGGQSVKLSFSPEILGDMLGIDIRDKTPEPASSVDPEDVTYKNLELNGQQLDELRFQKVSGSFNIVYITPKDVSKK